MSDDPTNELSELFPEGSRILVWSSPCGRRQDWGRREGNHVVIEHWEDASLAVEEAAALGQLFNATGSHGDGLVVGAVPRIISQRMRDEEWDDRDKARWLNDGDNARFRVNPGWRV